MVEEIRTRMFNDSSNSTVSSPLGLVKLGQAGLTGAGYALRRFSYQTGSAEAGPHDVILRPQAEESLFGRGGESSPPSAAGGFQLRMTSIGFIWMHHYWCGVRPASPAMAGTTSANPSTVASGTVFGSEGFSFS